MPDQLQAVIAEALAKEAGDAPLPDLWADEAEVAAQAVRAHLLSDETVERAGEAVLQAYGPNFRPFGVAQCALTAAIGGDTDA